jgi:hypothetical protein
MDYGAQDLTLLLARHRMPVNFFIMIRDGLNEVVE